ncbi:MAG TPA: DNA-directed RNA polymerase subunit beta', partial [Candidatus Gracilibacteria bacterium]
SPDMDLVVKKGDVVKEKQIIAKSNESKSTTKSTIDGTIEKIEKGYVMITPPEPLEKSYSVSPRATLKIRDGERVNKGRPLTIGHIDLRELMDLSTIESAQEYVLEEVLRIYASQGQQINEKHIEIIVKQMASKIRILDGGQSEFLAGEIRDHIEVEQTNAKLKKGKKKEIIGERLLLGLTRISLWTDSWLSAASFQETIRVLVEASTTKKVDPLEGLKENVIIGRLVPAGEVYRKRTEEGDPSLAV